jgi:hypothetical protein
VSSFYGVGLFVTEAPSTLTGPHRFSYFPPELFPHENSQVLHEVHTDVEYTVNDDVWPGVDPQTEAVSGFWTSLSQSTDILMMTYHVNRAGGVAVPLRRVIAFWKFPIRRPLVGSIPPDYLHTIPVGNSESMLIHVPTNTPYVVLFKSVPYAHFDLSPIPHYYIMIRFHKDTCTATEHKLYIPTEDADNGPDDIPEVGWNYSKSDVHTRIDWGNDECTVWIDEGLGIVRILKSAFDAFDDTCIYTFRYA